MSCQFAGDALLVCFAPFVSAEYTLSATGTSTPTLRDLTLRASQCALEVNRTFCNWSPTACVTLTLHTGLAAGLVFDVYVGSNARWEHSLFGAPISQQLNHVCGIAGKDKIVMSTEAWGLVSD